MNYDNRIEKEIAEENKRNERAKVAPPKIGKWQVGAAQAVWILGVMVLDAATAWIIWQVTALYYGALWLLVGAGGLIYSEWLRNRIGNNETQEGIADYGVKVSAGAVAFMALLAGAVWILRLSNVPWLQVLTEVITVSLFLYHLIQSYRFYVNDDDYVERNIEARENARLERELKQAHRAARRVESKKTKIDREDEYRKEYGGAFDEALKAFRSSIETSEKQPRPLQPARSFNSETDTDPTKPSPR